ncbi:MAG TPA: peptide ABC transporter substrate-binding protein [Herpetosiphonaceae bacterium]
MRRIRITRAIMLLSLALAGCMSAPPPAATPTPAPTSPPPASGAGGPADTLRWSLEGISDLASLDPAAPTNSLDNTVMGMLYTGLIRLDENLDIQPDGAESWTVSKDGTVYTFAIRPNLRFADGAPVTAGDYAYSINRALAPATASYGAPFQLGHIKGAAEVVAGTASAASGVRVVDDRTLEITLDGPRGFFLAQLSYPYTFAVPRSLVESGPDWQDRAYGSGPYKVKQWKHSQSITLAANEHYWRGAPGFAAVELPFHQDSGFAFQRYQAGQLDLMGSQQNPIPAAFIPEVRDTPDFKTAASLTTRYIGFNNALPPFDNPAARRALAQAVDKQALVDGTLAATVLKADRILPTGFPGTQLPIKPLAFDPAAARAALAEAGNLPPITLAYAREGDNELVAAALQQQWRDNLKLEVALQAYELEDFGAALNTTFYTPTAGLQLYLSVWGADYPDPQNFISQQLRTGSPNNNGHFSDAGFDRLVDEADRLGAAAEIDRRLQLYNQAEQIAIDKVGWLPLFYPKFNTLVRPSVEGLVVTPNGVVIPDWTKARRKN